MNSDHEIEVTEETSGQPEALETASETDHDAAAAVEAADHSDDFSVSQTSPMVDPFTASEEITLPVTVGDFVELYERAVPNAAAGNGGLLN